MIENNGAASVFSDKRIAAAFLCECQHPVEFIAELRRRFPEVKVVMLSGSDDEQVVDECLDAGALCFVGKSVGSAEIAPALHAVCGDLEISYDQGRASRPAPADRQSESSRELELLTRREREILGMVAKGGSNGELAHELWVSEQTVKFHLSNIYRKLEVSNRTQAAHRAWELGLIDNGAGAADRTANEAAGSA